MTNFFTKLLPRRAFLKKTFYLFGGVVVCADAGFIFEFIHGIEPHLRLRDKSGSFLDADFFPLANSSSFNASNFHYFRRVMELLDDSICFRSGTAPDFDGLTITVPSPCTYRDIPALMLVLARQINAPHFSRIVDHVGIEYSMRAHAVRECAGSSRLEFVCVSSAKQCEQLASLYGQTPLYELSSLSLHEIAQYQEIAQEVKFVVSHVEARLAAKRGELPSFLLTASDEAELQKLAKKSGEGCCDRLKSHIESVLSGCEERYATPLRTHLHQIIRVEFLKNLIKKNDTSAGLGLILARIKRVFKPLDAANYAAFETRSAHFLPVRIEHLLKISLKMDFEKGVYYTMMQGIPNKLMQTLEQCVVTAMRLFRNKRRLEILENISLENYVSAHVDDADLIAFSELKNKRLKPYPNERLIALLPEKHRQVIVEWQARLRKMLNGEGFWEIVSCIENREFSEVIEKLRFMDVGESALILYLLLSYIGDEVYYKIVMQAAKPEFINLLIPDAESSSVDSTLRVGENKLNTMLVPDSCLSIKPNAANFQYQEGNYEINRLKKTGEKINCVLISAIMNEIIERLLGLPSLGVPTYRANGKNINHLANGIRIGQQLLVIDVTNNLCCFLDMESCDGKNGCDTLDFANAYMNGAIDNVSIDERNKSFSNIEVSFIKAYLLESFPDRYAMARANLYAGKIWRNIPKYRWQA